MSPLAWARPCVVCGLEVGFAQDPDFRLPIHNECVPEYRERETEMRRDAAREKGASQWLEAQ